MEGKIVENEKGRKFPPLSIYSTLLSIASLSSVYLLGLPKIYHPTLVHRQHGIPCSLWTSNTRLASPILTEDTSGMVRSETDKGKGTAPPKPIHKIWAMGSIPANDKVSLNGVKIGPLWAMVLEFERQWLFMWMNETLRAVNATNVKWRSTMLGFFRRSLGTLKKTRNNHMNLNLQRWKHPMATRRTFPLLAPRTFLPRLS